MRYPVQCVKCQRRTMLDIAPSECRRYRAEPPTTAYCPACLREVRRESQAIMQQVIERGSRCTCQKHVS
jgi:uncharacterized protein YlaI